MIQTEKANPEAVINIPQIASISFNSEEGPHVVPMGTSANTNTIAAPQSANHLTATQVIATSNDAKSV